MCQHKVRMLTNSDIELSERTCMYLKWLWDKEIYDDCSKWAKVFHSRWPEAWKRYFCVNTLKPWCNPRHDTRHWAFHMNERNGFPNAWTRIKSECVLKIHVQSASDLEKNKSFWAELSPRWSMGNFLRSWDKNKSPWNGTAMTLQGQKKIRV